MRSRAAKTSTRYILNALMTGALISGSIALAQPTAPYSGPLPNLPAPTGGTCSGNPVTCTFPGPLPNQPPATATVEAKYSQNGPYAVSQLTGALDNTTNTSVDRYGYSYPCVSNTTGTVNTGWTAPTGNTGASNTGQTTVPYDIWYPTNLGKNGLRAPIIVFANGAANMYTPVQSDVATAYGYLFRHLASWGFVVIDSQSGEMASGLQMTCAAKYLISLNSNANNLVMVEEHSSEALNPDPFTIKVNFEGYPANTVTNINQIIPVVNANNAPITYSLTNPFYGNLEVNEIAVAGHSEGSTAATNAFTNNEEYQQGTTLNSTGCTSNCSIFKTLVLLEQPIEQWCFISPITGYPYDTTCQFMNQIKYGSAFVINGDQDTVVSPSTQTSACTDPGGNPVEQSDACIYADIPENSPAFIPKVWATLKGANHQDIGGQPWCTSYTYADLFGYLLPYQAAISYWTNLGIPPDMTNYPFSIAGPPAAANPCGRNFYSSTANAYGDNPMYGGVFGYLGYFTAWMMDQLQGDNTAHAAFINQTGELFQETTNWANQTSNITK